MRYGWRTYVPVGQKLSKARKLAAKVAKKQKRATQPIAITGRTIAKSFWGKAWCDHLESLSDYANRLPRGRTYVRNGSVVDLVIQPGVVNAIVAGSAPYKVAISVKKLDKKSWSDIKRDCSSSIDSLIDLLGGRLSDGVMQRLIDAKSGCFPAARQISMSCSCPDWSACCKHIAATMYAIGSRLDAEPELLFLLRGVNQEELIGQAVSKENLSQELAAGSGDLGGEDLGELFGIELDSDSDSKPKMTAKRKKSKATARTKKPRPKKTAGRKPTGKKTGKRVAKAASKKTAKKARRKVTGKTVRTKSTVAVTSAKKKTAKKKASKKKASKKKARVTKKKRAVKKKVAAKKMIRVAASKKKATQAAGTSKRTRTEKTASTRQPSVLKSKARKQTRKLTAKSTSKKTHK